MSAPAPRPTQDRWCDAHGTPIVLFCQVEQVADTTEHPMLPSWLHQRGQVVGCDLDSLYVCFPGNQVLSVHPQLLRVHAGAAGGD